VHDPRAYASILDADPLLHRLAMWTLREACRDAARWVAAGAPVRVAVEFQSSQVTGPAFVATVRELCAEAGCDPSLLELELIDLPSGERDLERTATALHALHADGVHITLAHVDDACSIRELRRLPLDTLRVGRATLDRLGPKFLETVVVIAQALALRVAASEIDSPAALVALEPHVFDDLAGAVVGASVPSAAVLSLVGEPRVTRRGGATSSPPLSAGA
jgi:EAL domain-containing protein (putative c-di-GMP-specific phosphodiesterase class I)